jgi:hypothetical protein
MPPVVNATAGLYSWKLTLADSSERTVLASSLDSAGSGNFPSPVIQATRGAAYDPASPAPHISAIVPASVTLGAPNFTVHVMGTGFHDGDKIVWNGSPEPTTFVSATELTTGVDMSTASVPIVIPIAVRSIAGADSNIATFEFEAV